MALSGYDGHGRMCADDKRWKDMDSDYCALEAMRHPSEVAADSGNNC